MSLKSEYAALYQQVSRHLNQGELRALEAARITLFDLPRHMRLDDITGAQLIKTVLESALERAEARAFDRLLAFYEKICDAYCLPKGLERHVSAAAQVPSPSAVQDRAVARQSEQRGKAQAS